MAKFLNTEKTSKKIIELIKDSKEFLTIVSPYVKINERLKEEIFFKKKINVNVVFGKTKMAYDEYMFLINCKNVSIIYNHNLHAKCYISEKGCIVSSMNLHEYSELNNFEMSVYFDAEKDEKIYNEIYTEVCRIVKAGEIKKMSDTVKKAFFL